MEKNEALEQEVLLSCTCGCCKVVVGVEDFNIDGVREYYISSYELSQYANSGRIKGYFRRLWSALIGKEYHLYTACISHEDVKDLLFWLKELE